MIVPSAPAAPFPFKSSRFILFFSLLFNPTHVYFTLFYIEHLYHHTTAKCVHLSRHSRSLFLFFVLSEPFFIIYPTDKFNFIIYLIFILHYCWYYFHTELYLSFVILLFLQHIGQLWMTPFLYCCLINILFIPKQLLTIIDNYFH